MKAKQNKRDYFIELIADLSKDLKLEMNLFCQEWIIKLSNKDKAVFIIGYNFGLNTDSCARICTDKTALYDILMSEKIPAVEHKLFHLFHGYNQDEGNWESMISFFRKNNNKVVVKPNKGTGGIGVEMANTLYELECHVYNQLNPKDAICLSPFINIENEYRVVMVGNTPHLVFKKTIPILTGNGQSSILELLNEKFDNNDIHVSILSYLENENIDLNEILEENKVLHLNWKHNLGGGASAELVKIEENSRVIQLAKKVTNTLKSSFVSVDIIQTSSNDYMVLEVNSGVMLVNFSLTGEKEYSMAKKVYKKAIESMFLS